MMKEIKRPFHAQKALRVACLVLADLILINLSAFLALYIRFEFDFRQLYATTFLRDMLIYAGINSVCTILIFHILKLYNSLWEFASVSELVRTALGCFFSAVFYMVGMFMLHLTVPRSFPAIYMLILCLLCGALRLSYRCVRRTRAGLRSEGEKRTMLIGGGQAGEAVEHQRRTQLHGAARHGLGEKARLGAGFFGRAGGEHVVSARQQAVFAGGYVIGLEAGVGVVAGDAGADVHRRAAACAHGGKVDLPGKGADVQPQIADVAQRFKGLVGHKDHAPSLHGMAGPPRACIAPGNRARKKYVQDNKW